MKQKRQVSNLQDRPFGTSSLEVLRAMPAQKLLDAALKVSRESFPQDIDGYFLPSDCSSLYAAGRQKPRSALAGWNKDEGNFRSFFNGDEPTVANYAALAKKRFSSNAENFLKVYSAATDAEAKRQRRILPGIIFIAYATWKWLDMQIKTGESPVFRYEFDQTLPLAADAEPGTEPRASHAWEIEFVFRVLSSRNLPWRPEDEQVSELMASYWTNFAKDG